LRHGIARATEQDRHCGRSEPTVTKEHRP
jgi:hypothetical protein